MRNFPFRRWAVRVLVVAAVAASVSQFSPAAEATAITQGAKAEAKNSFSFVTTSAKETIWDYSYANQVKGVTTGTVDVVMQQCHGGGFAADVVGTLGGAKGYTFSSAANWNESAWNDTSYAYLGLGSLTKVDNWTRAWVESLAFDVGMFQHYTDATSGKVTAPTITRDPYAPNGALRTDTAFENPQYRSPDTGDVRPNDARNIHNMAAPGSTKQQYAILVAWSKPEDRHAANINRVYEALQTHYGVPGTNIVILYGNSNRGTSTSAFPNLGLNGHFIDGPTSVANWTAALAGTLYTNGAGQTGTNIPTMDDQILIYNTGHGGQYVKNAAKASKTTTPAGKKDSFVIDSEGFASAFYPSVGALSGLTDLTEASTDADGTTLLQVSTYQPLPDGEVFINGLSAGFLQPGDPDDFIDLSEMIGSTFTYTLRFDHQLLASSVATNEIHLDIVTSIEVPLETWAALTFDGGDQIYAAGVFIPEPGTLTLLMAAGVGIMWRRRARG